MRSGVWRGKLAPMVARYGSGVAAVAAATLARWWLHPMFGSHRPFATYFIALPLIAWYAGLGPTLLTLLLGGLAAEVFFMEPASAFAMHDALDVRGPGLYAVLGLAIALVTAALRRTVEALRRSRAGSRAVVEGAFDCIITMDHEGRITAFNPAAERTFGYPRAAVIGRRMAEVIIPPPLRERHHRAMAHYLATGEGPILGRRLELTALRADGSEFPIELTINVIRLADETPIFTGYLRDITERKQAEEERVRLLGAEQTARRGAEASERRLAFLAEASAVLASSLECQATLEQVARLAVPVLADYCVINLVEGTRMRRVATAHADPSKQPLVERLREFSPDPASMKRVARVMRSGVSAMVTSLDVASAAAAFPNREHREIVLALAPRSYMLVALRARDRTLGTMTFVAAESGRRYGPPDLALAEELARRAAMAIDNARLYESERHARTEAEAATRARDAFLATVSHELRTPLSPILSWARMLQKGTLDADKARHALETIERSARSEAQLIEDLLDVSRIIAGKLRLDVRRVDLVPVIRAGIAVVQPAADAKNIRVQAILDPEAGTVAGDPERLQQVAWNLLSNAVKFTPEGGRVQVVLKRLHAHVEVAVSDTGQGIRPQFLPRIFQRFEQADSSMTRAHGGLGLGLAIVRHIVELHGGSVHAESAGEGRGAVFTVKLPLLMRRTAGEVEGRHPKVGAPTNGHDTPALNGLRVLVVDDEPDSNDVVSALLSSCGAEVRIAGSVAQALEVLTQWRTDVLVTDIGMPGEDGYGLLMKVRGQPGESARLPAVALTAYASRDDRIRLLSAGFQAHVPKPVDPDELVTVVANLGRTARRL